MILRADGTEITEHDYVLTLRDSPTALYGWPQQSSYGQTAEPIEVIAIHEPIGNQRVEQVEWRYLEARPGDTNRTPIGTFCGGVRIWKQP